MTDNEFDNINIMRLSAKRIFALTSVLQGFSSSSGLDIESKDKLLDIVTDNLSELADFLLLRASNGGKE